MRTLAIPLTLFLLATTAQSRTMVRRNTANDLFAALQQNVNKEIESMGGSIPVPTPDGLNAIPTPSSDGVDLGTPVEMMATPAASPTDGELGTPVAFTSDPVLAAQETTNTDTSNEGEQTTKIIALSVIGGTVGLLIIALAVAGYVIMAKKRKSRANAQAASLTIPTSSGLSPGSFATPVKLHSAPHKDGHATSKEDWGFDEVTKEESSRLPDSV